MSAGATSLVACKHCGTRFTPTAHRPDFCCSGCQFVNHLLQKRGFQEFYQFGETQAPAGNFVFHNRDFDWLRDLQKEAGAAGTLTLDIQGISCAGCVWLLEAIFAAHPGAISCRVSASSGTIELKWEPGQCDLPAYAADVQRFGYLVGPHNGERTSSLGPLTFKMGLCGALALNAMLFALPRYLGMEATDSLAPIFDAISLGIATLSLLVGGTYFFRRAVAALRIRALHIDLPISLGLATAYTGSVLAWFAGDHSFAYFDFISIFTFLMLLGRWLQERVVESNRQRLLGMKISPGRVRKSGGTTVPAESLIKGDTFSIARGQIVPVRSRLHGGTALFALNWITGEPAPRLYKNGSIVPAGARNLAADSVALESMEPWASSSLSSLIRIEAGSEWRNAGMHRLIRTYLTAILLVAAAGFACWGLVTGDWFRATQVVVSVLVVSCPCAIGVALPLLDDIAAARLRQAGLYIREGSIWARLREVRNILFDKTGTITLETLALSDPDALQALEATTKSTLLRLVESSLHPAATCLREALLADGVEPAPGPGETIEIAGMGLERGPWRLGRATWAGTQSSEPQPAGTVLSFNGAGVASFSFREEIRPDAASQIRQLRDGGRDVFILSGDNSQRATAMAHALDLPGDHAFGDLTPTGKADLVRSRWSGNSLMIGDGANDSLAFDAALCRGTPSVDAGLLEHKADFYMLGTSLAGLGALFSAAKTHLFTSRAVFAFAITYNAIAVAASLGGSMNPLVAAVIMPLSSLASILIVYAGFHFSPKIHAIPQP